jgi:hypothetical protein
MLRAITLYLASLMKIYCDLYSVFLILQQVEKKEIATRAALKVLDGWIFGL